LIAKIGKNAQRTQSKPPPSIDSARARPWFHRDKNYNNLRNDPEYQQIMEEVRDHIEQYRKAVAAD
jgi:hypothetical protein